MKAVRFHEYGPANVLTVEDVPRPAPGQGEVLVRVSAAAVNPIDWKFRAGYLKEMVPLELPHTPGVDLAGTVEEVGEGVSELASGDEVFGRGSGTYAEHALAQPAMLAPKPASLSFDEAVTLGLGGVTAWSALFTAAGLGAGQRLLVHGGAGGVGSLAVQLGRWKGAHVTATTSTANLDFVRSLGADEVVDYTAGRFEDAASGMDAVLDTVGGEVTDRSWPVIKPGGILVVIASMPDPETAKARGVRTAGAQPPDEQAPILRQLAGLVESGDLKPQIGRTFPLTGAADAHAASETGHGRGRIVLQVAG
ncbi:MAG TPA: NADP-dependent oxidoreductase [Gaiellales bacterium]|jgi:NADPH:quinone reductase-like Zn-dependent oxidoreductase|nr:NADP-dependent oxidoreductase [Gaiellales bacterium]